METILGLPGAARPVSISQGEQVVLTGGQPYTIARQTPGTISIGDPESLGWELRNWAPATAVTAWTVGSLAIFIPFRVAARTTVAQLWVFNGGTASGNLDLGFYDTAGNRLVSKGSTAQSGTSIIQVLDVTDTIIEAGNYFLGVVLDNTTGTVRNWTQPTTDAFRSMNVYQMAAAFPLPSTATFATMTQSILPFVGLTQAAAI